MLPLAQTPTLPQKISAILEDLRDEYQQPHERPWIIGFSGGKDSTLVLQLVCDMLLDLPPSQRSRPIHVLSNDTQVESPVVQAFVDRTLDQVREAVGALGLPITVVKTTPDIDGTFWVNLIGKGYPAPYRMFRWCTDRMKIRPTSDYIRKQASASGEVVLLLGVRRSESTARAKVVRRYDSGERLNPHNDLPGCLVYRPIVEMDTEEVWITLLQRRPAWGGSHRDLATLYRNAQGGECPFVVDKGDAPSCGTSSSRFGCWTCTVVEKDKSAQGFIDTGHEQLEPLLEFRDWIKEFSSDKEKYPDARSDIRRNGKRSPKPGGGPFTYESRQLILSKLLELQDEVGIPLISEAEVKRIKDQWREDQTEDAERAVDGMLRVWKLGDDSEGCGE